MHTNGHRNKIITISLIVLFSSVIVSCLMTRTVRSAYTAEPKPMEFYLHNFDIPVSVAGLQTKYVMNTTKTFKFLTQNDSYANSFYKPPSQPKITVDFYLYPNFAGPVAVNGQWQVSLWINGSAYRPIGFSLSFEEITLGGVSRWNQTIQGFTVTSSIGEYIDVPVYNYNLSTTLSHNFTVGTTLHVQIGVNTGSSADIRIWYDSPFYPSKIILPAQDYARATEIKTYAYDNSETSLFYYNWSDSQRIVVVRTNVTDPFGGYDIFKVNATIVDPTGNAVINNSDMLRTSDGQWEVNYAHIYEINWTYPTNATLGNYTVIVTVVDNNGYYNSIQTGAYNPFIEETTATFTIGIITYYDPVFQIVDDLNDPLPTAQVYITWPNGTTDTTPKYTSAEGFINLTQIGATSNIGFTILWKDVIVQQSTVQVTSNGPFIIKTRVYQLTVKVNANNGVAVDGAYVIIYTQSGVGYGLEITNVTGQAIFKLPAATYRIDVHYVADYWLTVAKSDASDTVAVTGSMTKTVVLAGYPLAIWATLGFLLLLLVVIMLAIMAFAAFMLFRRRRKGKK